jgi:hypothetical protein
LEEKSWLDFRSHGLVDVSGRRKRGRAGLVWRCLFGLADHVNFVGDSVDPGAFWAQDNEYIYFRVRTDVGTVVTDATDPDAQGNTFHDTFHVLIDQDSVGGTDLPDFGFSWDSKEKYVEPGLEMTEFDSITGTTWGTMKMGHPNASRSRALVDRSLGTGCRCRLCGAAAAAPTARREGFDRRR